MNIFVLLGVTIVFLVAMLSARNERWKRRLICPTTGTIEQVAVIHRFGDEKRPIRVTSCTLFPNAKRVGCSQDCIREGKLREP